MNVFLTGATGYIGSVVAEKLQSHGHWVIGLARSEETAGRLRKRGIEPYLGDMRDAGRILRGVEQAGAVIHVAAIRGPDMAEADRAAVEAILTALEGTGKSFLYTGSAFVYGDTGGKVVDEDFPHSPSSILPWRQVIERDILAATARGIRSVVFRVPMVYGRGGSFILPKLLHNAQQEGVAHYVGTGENRWSTVHVDDLADLYVRALEDAAEGAVFNAATGPAVSWRVLAEAVSHAAGAKGRTTSWNVQEASRICGPYAKGFTENQQLSVVRAQQLLGWSPQGLSVLDDLEQGSYSSGSSG